jgi:hypothetical protein
MGAWHYDRLADWPSDVKHKFDSELGSDERIGNGSSVRSQEPREWEYNEVKEELEIGLWRLSLWLEDLVAVRLF